MVVSTRWRVPAWTVEPERLRASLSQLRTILARVRGPELSVPFLPQVQGQNEALAERLAQTIHEIRRLDPKQYRIPRGPHLPPHQTAKLADTIGRLRRAWRERFEALFGEEKASQLGRMLTLRVPDLLGVLGDEENENAHSKVLRWLLDYHSAPHIASAALNALVGVFDSPDEWRKRLASARAMESLTVRREVSIGPELVETSALDRVDILISGPDFMLALENKVHSTEHNRQTWTYWNWLERQPNRRASLRGGIFLTPTGSRAACHHFRSVSYLELLALLLEGPAQGPLPNDEEVVLAGYIKTLANRVLARELRIVTG